MITIIGIGVNYNLDRKQITVSFINNDDVISSLKLECQKDYMITPEEIKHQILKISNEDDKVIIEKDYIDYSIVNNRINKSCLKVIKLDALE